MAYNKSTISKWEGEKNMDIKEMRKNKGITQKQLAEQIGANVRWVQKLEAGEIKLENITFLRAIKLILALTKYDDEKQVARDMYMITKRIMENER